MHVVEGMVMSKDSGDGRGAGVVVGVTLGRCVDMSGGTGMGSCKQGKGGEAMLVGCQTGSMG